MENKAECLTSVNKDKHMWPLSWMYIQRFFPFTVSERSEEGKLFQGQQEKVSGLSRKILVLARVSEKFRSPHSFTKIYKKRHYSFGKKGPKWIDLYIPKLVKNVEVVKSISEMKNIHGQEKKLEKMWKKNCKVRGKYNLEVYITLQLSRQ